MDRLITGTPDTRAEHLLALAYPGIVIGVGIPMAVAIGGIVTRGGLAISWVAAIVWGVLAAWAFLLVLAGCRSLGMTRLDLTELLGALVAEPHTSRSRLSGTVLHFVIGAALGVAWAYGVALIRARPNWPAGLAWGLVLWVLMSMLCASIGAVHPAIRRCRLEDPGPGGYNVGPTSPLALLLAHLAYGFVLATLYEVAPLAR